jgi:transcriptional regulator GlxA family with amidase domain
VRDEGEAVAECVGNVSLTPQTSRSDSGSVSELAVVLVAFDGVQPLDVVGPHEVFANAGDRARSLGRRAGYRVRVASVRGGPVRTESGLELGTMPLPGPGEPIDTLVVAGGAGSTAASADPDLIAFVRATASRCRRVAAVCTGAFILAAAGLLDGRRATTHWAAAQKLQATYPALDVDPGPLYIRDGQVWTSGGVTAGIDLALALVADDLGTDVAQALARWLVMFLHRPGGQTQFATPAGVPRAERSAVRVVQDRVESAPGDDHRLAALAAAASMSVRHFTRVFTTEVGQSPGRFVERVRLEAARADLEAGDDTLEVVAERCGLGSAESLRRVFHRHLGVSPDAYRRRFRISHQ